MICLIGNSGLKKKRLDGQTAKVRLYLEKLKNEKIDFSFIDLELFIKHPLSILHKIKKEIKKCDRIVLLTAERGIKVLLPFINKCNKKKRIPFVVPLIGISTLHYAIDKLSIEEKNIFLTKCDFSMVKSPHNMAKQLSKITYILPENEMICKVFREFYRLNNIYPLNNFRDVLPINKRRINTPYLKLIFISRVMTIKGIFDLLEVVAEINTFSQNIYLDIYGTLSLTRDEAVQFNAFLDKKFIKYKGILPLEKVISVFSEYDLFVFPTRYYGEGTPGVIAESLLAGTPILTSDFPQAQFLLNNGIDSIFFKMFNKEDLKMKLGNIISNKDCLTKLREGALESGKKYTYEHERKSFLKYVCGIEEDKKK